MREKIGVPEPEDCSPSPIIRGIWRLRLPGLPPARHQAGSQSFLIPLALSSCPCANFNLISLSSSRWGMRTAMLWGKQSFFMIDHPSKAALSPWAHTSKLPWPHICYYFTLLDTHHHKSTSKNQAHCFALMWYSSQLLAFSTSFVLLSLLSAVE